MKRRRVKKRNAPLRLPADVKQAVTQLAGGTGWSDNKALTFLAQAGWNALNAAGHKIPAMRKVMTAAVAHHETKSAMRKRLFLTARELQNAQRMLQEGGRT